MLIKIKGKRAFQVYKDEVISSAREVKDNAVRKLCYLDPGFDYEVKEDFGNEMVRRYPRDIAAADVVNTFPEQKAAPVAAPAPIAEAPAPKVKRTKKG